MRGKCVGMSGSDFAGEVLTRRLRLGMFGGGRGSLIGDSHRIAARIDARWELVAGAFDIDPERGRTFGIELGLDPLRSYGSWQQMLASETEREDRPDLIAVVTPNASHFAISRAVLEGGFHLLCEKPLTTAVEDARELVRLAAAKQRIGSTMYGYSGYPLVRQMRAMVAAGELGGLRVIQAEFAHGGHAGPVELTNPALAWRYDPAVVGPSSCLADAGSHALHMACFVSGQQICDVAALFTSHGAGRQLEDDAHLHLRFSAAPSARSGRAPSPWGNFTVSASGSSVNRAAWTGAKRTLTGCVSRLSARRRASSSAPPPICTARRCAAPASRRDTPRAISKPGPTSTVRWPKPSPTRRARMDPSPTSLPERMGSPASQPRSNCRSSTGAGSRCRRSSLGQRRA